MDILTQEQWLLNAQVKFDALKKKILADSEAGIRIDQEERYAFAELQTIGLMMLEGFAAGAGVGDEGAQVTRGERTLRRSDELHEKVYRSVFGTFSIQRWVYAAGPKKKIEYVPTDARLGLPRGECSYVLEDWQQRLCVKETFAEGVGGLGAILGVSMSVETAEAMNGRLAEYAERFRLQQPSPPAATEEMFVVATADGTSVPMHRADRTTTPSAEAGTRQGSTRRAYVGAVYFIEPFVREPQDVWNELFRDQAAVRRPQPQGKRLWAEMAASGQTSLSGSEAVFIEMAIDVQARDPDRQRTLVCVMDGEQKLWNLEQEWLGRSVEILDLFHASERIREVSKIVQPQDKEQQDVWVSNQLRDLLTGRVETVIRRWCRLARETEQGKRWSRDNQKTVTEAIGYFRNNRHRMQYDEYLSKGYPIGSGIAEGTCRNLVKDRMDCTGMHWRLPGARAMLKTRAIYLNGEWDDFIEYRIQREQTTLYHTAA